MIPDNSNRALFDMLADGIYNPFGIRAISDIIPQKRVPIRAVLPGMIEAGFQRLSVSVDVGEKRRQHGLIPIKSRVNYLCKWRMSIPGLRSISMSFLSATS
jgi:hypothetical protein